MAIALTIFPSGSDSAAFSAIRAYDSAVPDGLTKEIVARVAAAGLLAGAGDPLMLIQSHSFFQSAVQDAVAHGTSIVNAFVKVVLSMNLLKVDAGPGHSDAIVAMAGAVGDVIANKPLTVTVPATPAKQPAPPPDVDALEGLDVLSDEFEPLRLVLTRTLASVRPALYAKYRTIKDAGTATARADAYQFVFGMLTDLIERSNGHACD